MQSAISPPGFCDCSGSHWRMVPFTESDTALRPRPTDGNPAREYGPAEPATRLRPPEFHRPVDDRRMALDTSTPLADIRGARPASARTPAGRSGRDQRRSGGTAMLHRHVSRRSLLAGALGTSAMLALPRRATPAVKKGTALRMWILKTYVEPTNKAIEASAARWAQKHGASVTVEYFTFEDMQTKYVAAIENKSTPDVGQLETGAPARFAGMGQLLDLTSFAKQIEGEVGKPPANVAPVTIIDGKT